MLWQSICSRGPLAAWQGFCCSGKQPNLAVYCCEGSCRTIGLRGQYRRGDAWPNLQAFLKVVEDFRQAQQGG